MEDDIQEHLEAAQECVVSALTSFQEQKYDVAAVTCAIASTKLQMRTIKLLTKIKELRQHCLEQLEANEGREPDTEKYLRESKGREPTYWEVKCEQAYTDAKYGAYDDILMQLDEIIRENKELDCESLKYTVEEIKDEIEEIRASKDSEYLGNRLDEIKDNIAEGFEDILDKLNDMEEGINSLHQDVREKFYPGDGNPPKLSKSAAWDLVREDIVNAISLGAVSLACLTQLDLHFDKEIEEGGEKIDELQPTHTKEFQEARQSWDFIRGFNSEDRAQMATDTLDKYFELEEVK